MSNRMFVTVPALRLVAPARDCGSAAEMAARRRIKEDQAVEDLARRLFRIDPDDPAKQTVAGSIVAADIRHLIRAAFRQGWDAA